MAVGAGVAAVVRAVLPTGRRRLDPPQAGAFGQMLPVNEEVGPGVVVVEVYRESKMLNRTP